METHEFEKFIKVTRPAKMGDDNLRSVAYHEAGHVLISVVYGLPGTTTTIIPDKSSKSLGSSAWHHNESGDQDFDSYLFGLDIEWSTQKQIEYLVISLVGGIVGESYYTGEFNWEGAINDLNQILDVYLSYDIHTIPDLQPLWDKTVNIISQNLSTLKKIANDLYEQKTLTSEYFDNFKINAGFPAHL